MGLFAMALEAYMGIAEYGLMASVSLMCSVAAAEAILRHRERAYEDYAERMSAETLNPIQGRCSGVDVLQAFYVAEPVVSKEAAKWIRSCREQCLRGMLPNTEAKALAARGVLVKDEYTENAPREDFGGFGANAVASLEAVIACLMVVVGAVCVAVGADAVQMLWAVVGVGAYSVIVICDMKARIIPFEACAVLAVMGFVYAACESGVTGISGWLAGAAASCAMAGVCRLWSRVGYGDASVVGTGDLACLVATVCYLGIPAAGFGAVVAGIGLVALVVGLWIAKAMKRNTYMPLGPFFGTWGFVGCLARVACAWA